MSPLSNISLHERIPQAEIPSREVFEVKATSFSDIFPITFDHELSGVLGDYRGEDPDRKSPLYSLMGATRRLRGQTFRHQKDEDGRLTDEARTILAATDLQTRLIASIDKAHLNLMEQKCSPRTTSYVIEDYINRRDQDVYEYYELAAKRDEDLIARLNQGSGIMIPDYVVRQAFSDEELEEENPKPVSAELQQEAYREHLAKKVKLNRLCIQRLHFEWIASMVIVETLRESFKSDELALVS